MYEKYFTSCFYLTHLKCETSANQLATEKRNCTEVTAYYYNIFPACRCQKNHQKSGIQKPQDKCEHQQRRLLLC